MPNYDLNFRKITIHSADVANSYRRRQMTLFRPIFLFLVSDSDVILVVDRSGITFPFEWYTLYSLRGKGSEN